MERKVENHVAAQVLQGLCRGLEELTFSYHDMVLW